MRFLWRPPRLVVVAWLAGGYYVFPVVSAAAVAGGISKSSVVLWR